MALSKLKVLEQLTHFYSYHNFYIYLILKHRFISKYIDALYNLVTT